MVDERLDRMSLAEDCSRSELVRRGLDLYYRMVHSPGIDWEELGDRRPPPDAPAD